MERTSEAFKALRKGLGYCWSVATCASPDAGKALMETWFACDDRDVRWVMRQNLMKARLERLDARWVSLWRQGLSPP